MTITKRMALALALGSVMALAVSSVAQATHVRPQGAVQFRVPMVVAYNACALPGNRTHGPALSFPSCAPPVQASDWLTVGTTDANTFAPQSNGSVQVTVCPNGTVAGACSTPPGMSAPDVRLAGSATDVRCRVGTTGGQGQCEGGALSDYQGDIEANANIRITDHHNNVTPGGTGDTATVIDIPFPVVVPCNEVPLGGPASTTIGGSCSIVTRANAVVPGAVVPTKRANIEIGQIYALDGGQDGVTLSTSDNQDHFARQGIFIP